MQEGRRSGLSEGTSVLHFLFAGTSESGSRGVHLLIFSGADPAVSVTAASDSVLGWFHVTTC